MAEDAGSDRDAIVNQALYELARRFNFLGPNTTHDASAAVEPRGRSEASRDSGSPRSEPPPPPRPEPPLQRTLYVVNNAGDMHKVDKETFIIGRSRTCDLVIPSSKVSRQHSGICRENGEYFIEDLGSANGVWKDGVKIQKEKVHDGDEFMISEEILKFVFR